MKVFQLIVQHQTIVLLSPYMCGETLELEFLSFLIKKWLTIFDKALTPFWKTFLQRKQLFDAKLLI